MRNHRRRRYRHFANWVVVAAAVALAVSCSGGGGCGGCSMQEIPGGFPPTKRMANAGQIRITQSGIASITANPAALIGNVLGTGSNGIISYPISSCGSPSICCSNGMAIPNCGPVDIDLTAQPGDLPRLQLQPQNVAAPNGQLNVTVRARVKTENALQLTLDGFNCTITLDTTKGSSPDLTITTQVNLTQDGTSGDTDINPTNTAVSGLESADYSIGGDFECYVADFIPASTIEGYLASPIASALSNVACKSCTALADCGSPFATACTGGTCMEGSACFQELGLTGRLPASTLFASFSPGTTGALDLYEVAGGYSITADSGATGLSMGLLGGMEGGGSARDLCGPPATEPAPVTVPRSTYFEGNTIPGGSAFDIGIGLHKSELQQLGYAGYEGGIFCLTISNGTVSELTTDTVGLLSRSLTKLVENNSPMAVGLRPQSPPDMVLGPNTFTTNGSGDTVLTAPLLDVKFKALEIDFFAEVDDQWIRVMTVVADVDLPVGIDVGAGVLTPVLGDTTNAFTNLSVKNSQALTESPSDLASLFPTLLGLVLPQLASALPAITLPSIGGLNLAVDQVTAVDDQDGDGVGDFLAIYAHLKTGPVAMDAKHIQTTVDIANVDEPDLAIARDPAKWPANTPPRVTLALGAVGHDARDLQFSYRIDSGTWSPWSKNPNPTLQPRVFWLPGLHVVEVQSRIAGQPYSADVAPARITVPIGVGLLPPRGTGGALVGANFDPFHGGTGSTGCDCNANGGLGNAAPFALVIGAMLFPIRRRRARLAQVARRAAKIALKLGPLVLLIVLASQPGCSCSGSKSNACGDMACMTGTLNGSVGRWTSVAADDKRVMVSTYDQIFGDLVIGDATDATKIAYQSIDGVPDETPTYDPSTWRGGVSDPGPNVGAWTSIALSNHTARVAYQDRDMLVLKYAYEASSGGSWTNYVVDAGHGETVGEFTKLIIDADGKPTIAYLALYNDDGMGHRTTELRLARASGTDPQSASDWTISTVISGPGTCAGQCGAESCIAGSDAEVCVTPTTDCSAACGTGDVCYSGACVAALPDPMVDDIPTGTGLFPSLVVLTDGRLAVAYYDRTRRALILGVETAKGSSQFAENILDGNAVGADRGMWSSAVVGGDGTVHVVYQDALGDEVMYTTYSSSTAGTPEVVDDGERSGDRTHPVGASAVIWLNNGTPEVAYQDGLASDVYTATRASAGQWTQTDLAPGDLLDGFFISVATGGSSPVMAWDEMNPANAPPYGLVVQSPQ